MDDFDKQVRRSPLRLVVVGILLTLPAGFLVDVSQSDKSIVFSLPEGVKMRYYFGYKNN